MIVRKCYIDYAEKIVEGIKAADAKTEKYQKVISGTPQIGKSTFLSYMIVEIMKKTEYKQIVVISCRKSVRGSETHQQKTSNYASVINFLDTPDDKNRIGARHYLSKFQEACEQELASEIGRGKIITLLDGYTDAPTHYTLFGHLILFTSQAITMNLTPNMHWPAESDVLYMPVWDLAEMRTFRGTGRINRFGNTYTPQDLFDLFGGAIGYCVGDDAKVVRYKNHLYDEKIQDLCIRCQFNPQKIKEVDSRNQIAALVKIIPKDDGSLADVPKQWLTKKMEWRVNSVADCTVQQRLSETHYGASAPGNIFEEIFMKKPFSSISLKLYLNYNLKGNDWWRINTQQVLLTPEDIPRLINHNGGYFPTAFGILHRLSKNAPTVDYYFISRSTQPGKTGVIYLIQTTIAQKHGANFEKAGEYLESMENQISWNGALRQQSATDSSVIEDYPYIHADNGKELTNLDLLDGTVDIYLVYVQNELNAKFDGVRQNRNLNSRHTSRKNKLGAAIQTIYAVSKR